MGIKISGRVFDSSSSEYKGIDGVDILLIGVRGEVLRGRTDKDGFYFFDNIKEVGVYKVIEDIKGKNKFGNIKKFRNSTNYKSYKIEVTKEDILTAKFIENINFSHDNMNSFFVVKNNERVVISPIGDVFLVDTFNGEIMFEFNMNINMDFSNVNYNKMDENYYFISGNKNNEVFRLTENNEILKIANIDGLSKYNLEKIISNISVAGELYFMNKNDDKIFVLSLNPYDSEFCKLKNDFIKLNMKINLDAFTHNIVDNNIYGIGKNTNELKRIDVNSGEVTTLILTGGIDRCEVSIMFSDQLGYIYAIDNVTGNIYKIIISLNGARASRLGDRGIVKEEFGRYLNKKNMENSTEKQENSKFIGVQEKNNSRIESFDIEECSIDYYEGDIQINQIIKKEYIDENDIGRGRLNKKGTEITEFEILENVDYGSLNINITNGNWAYIPNCNFKGNDYFVVSFKENSKDIKIKVEIIVREGIEEVSIASFRDDERESIYELLNNKTINERINNYIEGEFNYSIKNGARKGVAQINRDTGIWSYEPYIAAVGADDFEVLISNRTAGYKVETINLDILNPKLYIEKSCDKESISFDGSLGYKIYVKNIGNIIAENVIIKDLIDGALLFEKGSLKINRVGHECKSLTFIEVGKIDIDESVEIEFKVYLNKVIEQKDEVVNRASARGEFKTNKSEEGEIIVFESNMVRTNIIYGNISNEDVLFISDKSVTTVGDIINFTVRFENTGNVNIEKLLLKDLVVQGTMFNSDSIIVDGEEFYFDTGNYGVVLDCIKIKQIIEIKYSLRVISSDRNILDFTPTLEYEYLVDYKKITRSFTFNTLSVANIVSKIQIEKSLNKDRAIVGDLVRCNILVKNIGDTNARDFSLKEYLEEGIIYEENLIIDGEKSYLSILKGIDFAVLAAGQMVDISFDILISSEIKSVNKEVKLITTSSYDYMVCGKTFSVELEKEEVLLEILKYDLKMEMNFSKEKVIIGEIFEAEIILINKGEITLNNVVVVYPFEKEFDVISTVLDGGGYLGELKEGINFGDICGYSQKRLKFNLKATDVIYTRKKTHIEIDAQIQVDEVNSSKISESTKIENILEVYNPSLCIKKYISKECVIIGEVVDLRIILSNIGDMHLEEIVVTDILSAELEFVEGSVSINSKPKLYESIISGINIDKISIGESIEIKCEFKVIKKPEVNGYALIKAFAIYNYKIQNQEYYNNHVETEECRIYINKIEVEIYKKSDKDFVRLGDEIAYEVTIINTGDRDTLNVLFIDELFEGVELVNRSFSIDGEFVNNVNITKGIIIGNINIADVKIIKYKVKVEKTSSKLDIRTKTYVKYSYILMDGSNGRDISEIETKNLETVDIALSNFRQIDKDEYLEIPKEKPDIEEIDNVIARVEILSTHLVETPIVNSIEGQVLSGYKLIVNGVINETIEYTSKNDSQAVYSAGYEMLFSDYIIMPVGFNINSRVEVEGKIENIYHKRINKREFFNNTTILLVAKILSV